MCILLGRKKELTTGRLRSFQRLNECFAGYFAQGSKERNMKYHYNVIHKYLLDGDPETLVLHIVPPPDGGGEPSARDHKATYDVIK